MTDQNPIVPSPELVKQWRNEWQNGGRVEISETSLHTYIANQAAQWGADQELRACCEWLAFYVAAGDARDLRTARRLKPPSLKGQALSQLTIIQADLNKFGMGVNTDTIRRALEALPND